MILLGERGGGKHKLIQKLKSGSIKIRIIFSPCVAYYYHLDQELLLRLALTRKITTDDNVTAIKCLQLQYIYKCKYIFCVFRSYNKRGTEQR